MNVLSNWTVREKKPNTLKPFTEMIFGDRVFIHLLTTNINVTDHATKSLTLAHIIITNDLLADSMTNNHVAYGFFFVLLVRFLCMSPEKVSARFCADGAIKHYVPTKKSDFFLSSYTNSQNEMFWGTKTHATAHTSIQVQRVPYFECENAKWNNKENQSKWNNRVATVRMYRIKY